MRLFALLVLVCSIATLPAVAQEMTVPAQRDSGAPTFLSLASAIYNVPDLDEASQWYQRALRQEPYSAEINYVGFRIGMQELGLVTLDGGNVVGNGGAIPYWLVQDADAALAHLVSVGASTRYAVAVVAEGVRVAVATDPYDNLIGLIEVSGQD